MRLTLRTLLAYRDGVLDAADAAVLEKKIQESGTSRQISNRIDEAMINTRLAPIPVDVRDFGFDANMVAQFLDDTIPVDLLPQMERACLESNALLGELGSCHQILSYVVSVPAPISDSLRERIRNLPQATSAPAVDGTKRPVMEVGERALRIDEGTVARKADEPAASPVPQKAFATDAHANTVAVRKTVSELRKTGIELNDGLGRQVPEYLTGMDRRWLRQSALLVAMVVGVLFVGSKAIGPWDSVRKLLSAGTVIANRNPKANDASGLLAVDRSKDKTRSGTDLGAGEPSESNIKEPDMENDSEDSGDPIIEADVSAPPPMPGVNPSIDKEKVIPKVVAPSAVKIQWLPESKSSSEALMLVQDPRGGNQANHWNRLNPGDQLAVGSRLVIPPATRTELRVEPGIRWVVAGESDLTLAARGEVPQVQLWCGRALIFASPDAQTIEVQANQQTYAIRFAALDASCAIQVQNTILPTQDKNFSEVIASQIQVQTRLQVIGVQGSLKVAVSGANADEGTVLNVGQSLMCIDGRVEKPVDITDAPWWLRTSVERPIDQVAATDIQRALTGVMPDQLTSELRQLVNHRKPETAALAGRTRMLLGEYDLLFSPDGVLNRRALHAHWQSLVQQIPQTLGRPDNRQRFIATFTDTLKERAGRLLALIVPKSNEQLEAGADKMLLESLSVPSMDERILAIYQLSQITGSSLGYHPDKNNADSLQQWRKALTKGEIRFKDRQSSTGARP